MNFVGAVAECFYKKINLIYMKEKIENPFNGTNSTYGLAESVAGKESFDYLHQLVGNTHFACVAAKAALKQGKYAFAYYDDMTCLRSG